jgi:hypothetical protein
VETARSRCGGFVYISWGIRCAFGRECDGFCRVPFENSDEFDLSLDSLALPSPSSSPLVRRPPGARSLSPLEFLDLFYGLHGSRVFHACSKRVQPNEPQISPKFIRFS